MKIWYVISKYKTLVQALSKMGLSSFDFFSFISSSLMSLLFLVFLTFNVGCKKNLSVQSGNVGPNVQLPIISVPSQSPFYSQSGSLLIQGVCKTGAIINLSGASTQSFTCANSVYEFNVNQAVDGVYNFIVRQNDNGALSVPVSLIWTKKSSVSQPSINNPPSVPYSSSEAVLNIQGGCETGSLISLSQDAAGSVECLNSTFSINVPKFVDGSYVIDVTQTDLAGNQATSQVIWNKLSLNVIPNNPQVIVGMNETFNISGGTPPYSVTLTQNSSANATYSSLNNTYTAGTTAGGTDILLVSDAQGFERTINIQVLADVPDHFEFPTASGDNQSEYVGAAFSEPLVVRVVDRYGNGVNNYPVLFQRTAGDVTLVGNMQRSTNAIGEVSMSVIQGYKAARSYVSVIPALGNLPDLAATGLDKARFLLLSQTRNTSNFDLHFNVGNNPDYSVVADINGDGFQDVLILNKGGPSISRRLGQGKGLFTSLTNIVGLCSGPAAMTSADFNNDGFVDLILACNGVGQYSYLSGRGDGSFNAAQTHLIDPSENFPIDIAVGDFNNDGAKDIIIVSLAANLVGLRLGNNDGTFGSVVTYATGNSPSKVAIGDLNNDGFDDFVVLNAADETFSAFLNQGDGTFLTSTDYSTGVAPAAIILSDLNSDGFKDVIVANNVDDNIGVYLNLNDGSLDLVITTSVGLGPISLVAKDFNGDGFMDLATANIGDSTTSLLFGFNNGTFDVQPAVSSLLNPININAADFNDDTVNDLLLVSNGESKFQIIPIQADGTVGFITATGANSVKVISADVNGDGFLDKAVVNQADNNLLIYEGDGKGFFSLIQTLNVGNGPTDATFVDLNNDNILDLVVVLNSASAIRVFMGQGAGVFSLGSSFPTQSQPTSLASGDFNKDGFKDIVVTCSGADRMNFFPGLGDGTFGARTSHITGAQPSHITTGDFNEDYLLDIAVTNQSAGTVTVFLSGGNGTFLSAEFNVEDGPNGILSGFFNADGFLDLAVSNNLSGSISILRGRGDGTFDPAANYFAGPDPVGMSKGDLNGNGREDLVVGNGINQGITMLFGSFGGDYSSNNFVNTGMNSNFVSVDDVNNDGAIDITILDDLNSFMKVLVGQ